MRNNIVIYKPTTDLRGKRVELRSGEIVDIPKDANRRTMHYCHATLIMYNVFEYSASRHLFQNTRRISNDEYETDIMKVVK